VAVGADEERMSTPPSLGRVVLRLVVASLIVAGGAACVALLRGDITDVDWKIIATSTLLALVSATVGSGLAVRFRHPLLGQGTALFSLLTFALVVIGMWPESRRRRVLAGDRLLRDPCARGRARLVRPVAPAR
jgi:uncharacterized membrane protein YfcA